MHSTIIIAMLAATILTAPLPGLISAHGTSGEDLNTRDPISISDYRSLEAPIIQARGGVRTQARGAVRTQARGTVRTQARGAVRTQVRGTVRTQARAVDDNITLDQKDEEVDLNNTYNTEQADESDEELEEIAQESQILSRAVRHSGPLATPNEERSAEPISRGKHGRSAEAEAEASPLLRINSRSLSRNKNSRSAEAEAEAEASPLLRINSRALGRNKNARSAEAEAEASPLVRFNSRALSRNKNSRSAEAEAEASPLLRINSRALGRNKNSRSAEASAALLNSRDVDENSVKVESGAQEIKTQTARGPNKRVAEAEPVFRSGGK